MRGGGPAPRPPPPPSWKTAGTGEDEPEQARRSGGPGSLRKKGAAGVRAWTAVDSSGQAHVIEAGKHTIMRRTGIPARDLRILDPLLSYPSTVLGRERAIVINLEHIKAIITAQEVLLLNARDPFVIPFVHQLQRRFLRRHNAATADHVDDQERRLGSDDAEWSNAYEMEESQSRTESPPLNFSGDLQVADAKEKEEEKTGPAISNGPRVLPFEFIALEACLEAACGCLENETTTLEQEAHPALDKLTSKISTLNLERVRQIKSRLVAITGRVQKVRDELEHLLDDDDDMAEMYLTDKLLQQGLYDGSSSHCSLENRDAMEGERTPPETSSEANDAQSSYEDELETIECQDRFISGPNVFIGNGHGTCASSTRSGSKHLDVDELEMLLEAYFVHIDGTLNKLSTLREYVDDTEDYINIMLDDKQNHLLQMGVMLTTATLIVSAFVVLAGIFGMNIKNDLFDESKSGTTEFLWTVGGGATGSVFLYVIATAWCKHRRLLE